MNKRSGFTMIELMTMMAVIAVVLAIGAPQLMIFFQGNRMVTNTNELVAGLHVARSEAVKRSNRVSICKSSNADTASPSCDVTNDGTGWENGFIVFVEDSTRTGAGVIGDYDTADNDVILRVNAGAEGNTTIKAGASQIFEYVSFTSRGEPKQPSGASQSGTFDVCDDRGKTNAAGNVIARGVVLSAAGRVRVTKDANLITCP